MSTASLGSLTNAALVSRMPTAQAARDFGNALRPRRSGRLSDFQSNAVSEDNLRSDTLSSANDGLLSDYLDEMSTMASKRQCVNTPNITMDDVQELAVLATGLKSASLIPPDCPQEKVFRSEFGLACQYPQESYLKYLYDAGLFSMAYGASPKRAFGPFMNARVVAHRVKLCVPSIHSDGHVTIPDSYHVLYQLFSSKLFALNRELLGGSLAPPSSNQMEQVMQLVFEQRRDATKMPLDKMMDVEGNSSTLLKASELMKSWSLAVTPTVRASTPTDEGAQMTEEMCDEDVEPSAYRLHLLRGVELEDAHEVCCAQECEFVALYGRTFANSASNCCLGCNRWRCRAVEEVDEMLASPRNFIRVARKRDLSPHALHVEV